MIIRTKQIGRGRLPEDGIDITVKSAKGVGVLLAPTWEMVLGHKAGKGDKRWPDAIPLTDEEYTTQYYALLDKRMEDATNRRRLAQIFSESAVTLLCYCPAGDFCHRHLAAHWLMRWGELNKIPVIIIEE